MTKKIKVFLVDDHALVLASLKLFIEQEPDISVIGEASTGEEALKALREKTPDIVIMDIEMPGIGGMEAAWRISRTLPNIKVIILTSYDVSPYPSQLMKMGAKGFLTKSCSPDELCKAIREVFQDRYYMSKDIALKLALENSVNKKINLDKNTNDLETENQSPPFSMLTRREMQIFNMISKGVSVKQIALTFSVSLKNINGHRYKIYKKLNVKTDVELARLAIKYNLIPCKAEQ